MPVARSAGEASRRSDAGSDGASSPPAERLRRPSWRDPRLLVGVLIVALSVSGVIALLSAQNRTAEVYAAERLLSVGERLSHEDLRVVDVQIDEVSSAYLLVADELPEEALVVSMVDEGELLPRRAVAQQDPRGRQAVTVDIEHTLARGVEPGRLVDVWSADPGSIGAQEEVTVERIASAAEVSVITETSTTFGAQTASTVELLVEPQELSALLAARSSSATLSVVPAGDEAEESADAEAAPDGEEG